MLPVGASLKLATREIIAVISGITRDVLGGIFQFVMRGLPTPLNRSNRDATQTRTTQARIGEPARLSVSARWRGLHSVSMSPARRESNAHRRLRRPLSCPLDHCPVRWTTGRSEARPGVEPGPGGFAGRHPPGENRALALPPGVGPGKLPSEGST